MVAFLEGADSNSPPQTVKLGDYTLNITFGVPACRRAGFRGFGGPLPTGDSQMRRPRVSCFAAAPANIFS